MKETVFIENAKLFYRNFAGEERRYNPKGRRNFCVELNPDLANALMEKGWNIKSKPSRDDPEDVIYFVQVEIRYNVDHPEYNPDIFVISGDTMKKFGENRIGILDNKDFINVDIEINPAYRDDNGTVKIKAYAKAMWITVRPNPFEEKYAEYYDQLEDDCPFN